MKSVNLEKINQTYILNNRNFTLNTVKTNENAKQLKDNNSTLMKTLIFLAVLGSAIVSGAAKYKNSGNKVIQKTQQSFPDNSKIAGKINSKEVVATDMTEVEKARRLGFNPTLLKGFILK